MILNARFLAASSSSNLATYEQRIPFKYCAKLPSKITEDSSDLMKEFSSDFDH